MAESKAPNTMAAHSFGFETLRVNEIAMRNAEKTFMLVISSKFLLSSHVACAAVQQIHTIITDDGIANETLASLKQSKVYAVCANTHKPEYKMRIVD